MQHGIKKLTDAQHIRLRVPMYLGSNEPHTQSVVIYRDMIPVVQEITWTPALFTCLREIIDNALDEIIGHGFGDRIDVEYDPATLTFSVKDNGRGIPFDFDKTHNQYLATMVLTEPRAGRNFDERGEVAGVNGIGSSAVAITSEWFKVEIWRGGKKFMQTYREDIKGTQIKIEDPKITSVGAERHGTHIRFTPSKAVFQSREVPEDFIRSRVTEVAICNPTLKVYYNGTQIKVKPRQEQTLFPKQKPVTILINEGDFRSKFWINYVGDEQAGSSILGGRNEHIHSLVNNIPTFNGGVHVDAFRRAFYANLIEALGRESKRRKLMPNRSDVQDGLFVYNITNMKAPNFDSQSKTRLINEEVASIIKKHFENPELYRDIIRKNPEWIDAIYARCAERTMKKDAAELAKTQKATKRLKIVELEDASGTARMNCSLFLCEGKSAVSGITEARDASIHGALPLRGKVLNVYGKHLSKAHYGQHLKKVADNEALKKIASAIGLVVGQKAVRSQLRYGKVYIATDADPDGDNISALLVNYFYQLWPELFDPASPFLYFFQTPFIIAKKGKTKKYWYSDDYDDFNPEDYKGWEITRAKGLAALKKDDWKNELANPRVTPVVDEGDLSATLDLLFSPDADARKEWLAE
jgi:DNA gyrase/topoisomerase IV subunit B